MDAPVAQRPCTPPPFDGLEFNRCRNVVCENFNVAPDPTLARWGSRDSRDTYLVSGSGEKASGASPMLQCRLCGTSVTLLSNRAIVEERDRLLEQGAPLPGPSCRNATCVNLGKDVNSHPELYQRFGTSGAGSRRHRCRACGSTFSRSASSSHRLRKPAKTLEVFRCLINKVAMRRTCELAGIGPETLYQRIDLIYHRCREFAARREVALFAGEITRARMHFCVDRQDHTLNSGTALDSRPSVLRAVASAEATTGYIIAQHLNFDPTVDPFSTELLAREAGDPDVPWPFRKFSRLWLPHERLETRTAIEAPPSDSMQDNFRPTARGAHVHEVISIAAHFQLLERCARGAAELQITMDREPSIERCCLLTFAERIRAGDMDAFVIKISKEHSQAQKRKALSVAEAVLAKERARRPGVPDIEILLDMIEKRFRQVRRFVPKLADRWVEHPFPTMNEPDRAILCLSDNGEHSMEQLRLGFARASLRSIDRYFMQVRRKIHLLERPISSSSAGFRRYHGYSAYSALVVMQVLTIFRVVYNFHLTGKQATTPAQRLGVAAHRYLLEDLLDDTG